MTLDPRARRLLDMMALSGTAAPASHSVAARRESFAKLMAIGSKPVAIGSVENLCLARPGGDISLRIYRAGADRNTPTPVLVFFHGGGLVAGGLDTHDSMCRSLANSSGAAVISVDYRLAPEHKFPAALDDARFAVDWIAHESKSLGIDSGCIAIGGESAGALLVSLIGNGYQRVAARIKAMLLLCPVIDLTGNSPSRAEFARGFLIDAATVQRDVEYCLEAGMRAGDLPSPLRCGDARRSPPTIIISAEYDPFRDEARLYADRLIEANVPVQYTCHPGMIHSFFSLNAMLPQAEPALLAAGKQLKALLT
jgi:acetyl esterase